MWLGGMVDLSSRVIGSRTTTHSGKSNVGSRVGIGSIVGSKSKKWNSHSFPINGMWPSKIGDSISRSMGMGINFGSVNWSKLGKNAGVNIDLKMETES